jgi:hypothetical protein
LDIPDAAYGEAYGKRVQLDETGNTLAIWRAHGGKAGINAMGNVDIFAHAAGWNRVTTIQIDSDLADCGGIGLSGNGQTLARACVHGYPPPAFGYVEVFRAPSWTREVKLDNPSQSGHETRSVVIARDGNSFAVQRTDGHSRVAVFRRGPSGWQSDGVIDHGAWSPDNDFPARTYSYFGEVSSVSADGRFLAVGSRTGTVWLY